MRIAVTGSSGFIGSHLSDELKHRNNVVIDLIRPNLDDVVSLTERLKGVETVCHCAWAGHPRNEVDSQRNIFTSLVVAKAADTAGVKHMVFMSSGGGTMDTSYAKSKKEVEALFSKEFGLFNFDLTVIRPTAVYGAGQDPSKGLGAITTFISAIMANKPIHILGSPHSGRDFLHVKDLVECVNVIIEDKIFGTFDVGGPEVVQLVELVSMIEAATGKIAQVQIENPTGVDPQTVRLNNSLITAVTGWAPSRCVVDSLPELISSMRGK